MGDIDVLKNEANQYKLIIAQLENDLGKLIELENKCAMLSSEIELGKMVSTKNEEVGRMKQYAGCPDFPPRFP